MIVGERKPTVVSLDFMNVKNDSERFLNFGTEMRDGRLTEPSDGKRYRIREAILLSKRLGRPLTEDEME